MPDQVMLKDLPEEVLRKIEQRVLWYTVGLLGLKVIDGIETIVQQGTGTFVSIENKIGILTAFHVVNPKILKEWDYIGLGIRRDEHSFKDKATQFTVIYDIEKPNTDEKGPDWSFLEPPESMMGFLSANKQPWNLSTKPDSIPQILAENDFGFGVLSGFPCEMASEDRPRPGFDRIVHFDGICGLSGIKSEWIVDSYDYVELDVPPQPTTAKPKRFGGVSGGGLWWATIEKNKGDETTLRSLDYIGIAYCEMYGSHGVKAIRCHGQRSVYKKIPEVILSKSEH